MTKDKHRKFVFLIRHQWKITIVNEPPEGVELNKDKLIWHLHKHPPRHVGCFDKELCQDDPPLGIIGVFDPSNLFHLKNLLECHKWHLEDMIRKKQIIL